MRMYIYNVFTIREIERITYIYIYHPIPVSRSHLHIDAPCGPLSIARSEGAAEPQCHISSHGLVDVPVSEPSNNQRKKLKRSWLYYDILLEYMIYY